jgi:hypothetical protein
MSEAKRILNVVTIGINNEADSLLIFEEYFEELSKLICFNKIGDIEEVVKLVAEGGYNRGIIRITTVCFKHIYYDNIIANNSFKSNFEILIQELKNPIFK